MSDTQKTRPERVRAPHGATVFEVDWADGVTAKIPHQILRGYCPCAGCQGHKGTIRFVPGGDLEIVNIEQVGNYALRFDWGDHHGSGIYSFSYLRLLSDLVQEHGDALPERCPELPR